MVASGVAGLVGGRVSQGFGQHPGPDLVLDRGHGVELQRDPDQGASPPDSGHGVVD